MSPNDVFYWVIDGVRQPTGYTVIAGPGPNYFTYSGELPAVISAATQASGSTPASFTYTNDSTGIFVYKRSADVLRWARDATLMKMASTTFSYQVGPIGPDYQGDPGTRTQARYPVQVYPPVQANGIVYETRYQQSFDKAALANQIRQTRGAVMAETLFLGAHSTEGVGQIVETMTPEIIATL